MALRILLHGAALLAALLCCAAPATGEEAVPDTWYAQNVARGETGLNVTYFWSKGAKMRSETVVGGQKIVTIVNGPTYFAYNPLTMEGVAIARPPAALQADAENERPFGDEYSYLVAQGAELVREEEVMGRPTSVYRLTDDFGRRELWVTKDEPRIPLRLEVYNRATTRRIITDYVDWQKGLDIDDAFFEPNPRAKLEALDYATYVKRRATQGSIGPVPVLHSRLLDQGS